MAFPWYPFSSIALQSLDECTARQNIWEGAVRSSKTITSIVAWLDYVHHAPPGKLLMIGKTERTLRRNILDIIEEIVGTKCFKHNRGLGEVTLFGRQIVTVGANDERAEGKIRGSTYAGAYGDEITLWPESLYTMMLSRLSVAGSKFFGTTNPDNPRHWFKLNYLDRADKLNLRRWSFRLEDNLGLDPEYVESLKAEYTGLWYKRYILGMWVTAEGAIYDMFDEDFHVVDTLPEMTQYWISIDYGTTNPTVFLLIGAGVDKRLYVIDEWRYDSREHLGRQKTDKQYHMDLWQWIRYHNVRPRWVWVDPSAASFITEISQPGPYHIPNVALASNSVLDGIRWTSTLFDCHRLRIHRRCKGLIDELYGYAWDTKASEHGEDRPLKILDHGPDALRYDVLSTMDVWLPWLDLKD